MNMRDKTLFSFGYSLTTRIWHNILSTVPRILPKHTTYLTLPEDCQSLCSLEKPWSSSWPYSVELLHCFLALAFKPIHLHLQKWLCKVRGQCPLLREATSLFQGYLLSQLKTLKRCALIEANQVRRSQPRTPLHWDSGIYRWLGMESKPNRRVNHSMAKLYFCR